eukprot:CAMPEP_0172495632 /NCGR_PEP_ID=MMETSP1066-20121228/73205_1 /TAXON_ID=671091 /ORGANISM="Coscinodiscus wailesii, Strain CCMP2513" /LENGTH=309 /DNA_ID=CAMNT_0013267423 /DNA_START=551 /DNA_END=1480 /DNA_ORIENTATION=-
MAIQSGGRMGGSFSPSSRQSYSRPAPSRSYSRGYGTYSPPVVVTPSPYYSPFSYWGGPRFFGGYPSAGGVVVARGPSFFDFIVFAGIVAFAVSAFGGGGSVIDDAMTTSSSALGAGVSVAQISVALDVPRRDEGGSILSVLERLSQTARTDSRVGVQNLTSQVALELLRQKRSIFASSSKYGYFRDNNKAQRQFNDWAVRERSKFERETLSKYGGVDYSTPSRSRSQDGLYSQATVAVVTIILAIDGDHTKIPPIKSFEDIEVALRMIASDVKVDDCLQSAEILWSPEERTETLSRRDIIADYPDLRNL